MPKSASFYWDLENEPHTSDSVKWLRWEGKYNRWNLELDLYFNQELHTHHITHLVKLKLLACLFFFIVIIMFMFIHSAAGSITAGRLDGLANIWHPIYQNVRSKILSKHKWYIYIRRELSGLNWVKETDCIACLFSLISVECTSCLATFWIGALSYYWFNGQGEHWICIWLIQLNLILCTGLMLVN